MPKSTIAGHPAHPQLVTFPIALFPFSLVLEVLHGVKGEKRFADAAELALQGAVVGAAAAAAAGAMDYLEIPEDHPAKPMARLHGGMNLGLIGLFGAELLMRRRRRRRRSPGRGPGLLSLLGNTALLLSGWYGAQLVYEHGMRVRGRSPIGHARTFAAHGDAAVARALETPFSDGR